MDMMTRNEFTCASVMGRSCTGIGIVKKILAPAIEIPYVGGFVSTLMTIPQSTGKAAIAI
jgi:hypothetical protein